MVTGRIEGVAEEVEFSMQYCPCLEILVGNEGWSLKKGLFKRRTTVRMYVKYQEVLRDLKCKGFKAMLNTVRWIKRPDVPIIPLLHVGYYVNKSDPTSESSTATLPLRSLCCM